MAETADMGGLITCAETVAQTIRAMNHRTLGSTLPAPTVYDLLGNMKFIGYYLPQTMQQISDGLVQSLIDFDVTEDDGTDPVDSVLLASHHLTRAGHLAAALGVELEHAQSAIARQGYSPTNR